MSEVSIGYHGSPLNGSAHASGGPQPGERVAPREGDKPLGAGDTPRFILLAAPTAETSALVTRFDTLLDPVLGAPLGSEGLWLCRPDGYLACSSNSPADIADYLQRIAA
jgi:hypothetical protein